MWRVEKGSSCLEGPGKITNNCSTVFLEVLGIAAWELLQEVLVSAQLVQHPVNKPEQLFECLLL